MGDVCSRFPDFAAVLTAGAWHAAAATGLACVVWAVTRVWRNPHAGRVLWGAALVKLLIPPVLAVPILIADPAPPPNRARQDAAPSVPEPRVKAADAARPTSRARQEASPSTPDRPGTSPTLAVPPPAAALQRRTRTETLPDGRGSFTASVVAVTIWAVGTLCIWGLAAVRAYRFGRRVRRLPDAGDALTARLGAAAALFEIPPPRLKVSANVGPLAWAAPVRFGRWNRPFVVVPEQLLNDLPADAAEALLAHECAHLARRDELWRLTELLACGLWWWLPTAWLAASAGRRREELCCDAAVLHARRHAPDPAGPYAAALLAAAEFLVRGKVSPVPTPASGAGRPGFLQRRFTMICENNLPARPGRRLRWPLAAAAVALAAVGVTAGQEGGTTKKPVAEPSSDAPSEEAGLPQAMKISANSWTVLHFPVGETFTEFAAADEAVCQVLPDGQRGVLLKGVAAGGTTVTYRGSKTGPGAIAVRVKESGASIGEGPTLEEAVAAIEATRDTWPAHRDSPPLTAGEVRAAVERRLAEVEAGELTPAVPPGTPPAAKLLRTILKTGRLPEVVALAAQPSSAEGREFAGLFLNDAPRESALLAAVRDVEDREPAETDEAELAPPDTELDDAAETPPTESAVATIEEPDESSFEALVEKFNAIAADLLREGRSAAPDGSGIACDGREASRARRSASR